MTYIVSSGALNSTPTNQRKSWGGNGRLRKRCGLASSVHNSGHQTAASSTPVKRRCALYHIVFVCSYARKLIYLSISPPPILTNRSCCLLQVVMQVMAPGHYSRWLRSRVPSVVNILPSLRHARGLEMTSLLLSEAENEPLASRLLGVR